MVSILNAKNISKIDKNGRIYIPKQLRKILGLKPGDLVEINIKGQILVIKRAKTIAERGKGVFKPIKGINTDDIDKLIEAYSFLEAMEDLE